MRQINAGFYLHHGQCCELSDFVAIFSDFFSKKPLATNLVTFAGVIRKTYDHFLT